MEPSDSSPDAPSSLAAEMRRLSTSPAKAEPPQDVLLLVLEHAFRRELPCGDEDAKSNDYPEDRAYDALDELQELVEDARTLARTCVASRAHREAVARIPSLLSDAARRAACAAQLEAVSSCMSLLEEDFGVLREGEWWELCRLLEPGAEAPLPPVTGRLALLMRINHHSEGEVQRILFGVPLETERIYCGCFPSAPPVLRTGEASKAANWRVFEQRVRAAVLAARADAAVPAGVSREEHKTKARREVMKQMGWLMQPPEGVADEETQGDPPTPEEIDQLLKQLKQS